MDVGILQPFRSRYSDWIAEALKELDDCFLITDPSICKHPIVFASHRFLQMFGYQMHEVIGENGRMFQGRYTDRRTVLQIREAIREERPIQVEILNYKKDGEPLWILFHLFPVFRKEDGQVSNFVSVHVPIESRSRRKSVPKGLSLGKQWSRGGIIVSGSCRAEISAEEEIMCNLAADYFANTDDSVPEAEHFCEANDVEKQKAIDASKNILSTLIHYSEFTGMLVSGKQCKSLSVSPLSSSLLISLGRIKQSFVLIDPRLPDMPIVYASDAFLCLTDYSKSEVLGQNYRFLNGPLTDVETLNMIKENVEDSQSCSVRLLNYRKDGSSFWNLLHISPVRNSSGKIAFFVAVQILENAQNDKGSLSPEMSQFTVVGAVKVAVRGSSLTSSGLGSSKSRQSTFNHS